MSLDEAVNAGLVRAQFDDVTGKPAAEPTYETKTYAIGFVLDQVSRFVIISTCIHHCHLFHNTCKTHDS